MKALVACGVSVRYGTRWVYCAEHAHVPLVACFAARVTAIVRPEPGDRCRVCGRRLRVRRAWVRD